MRSAFLVVLAVGFVCSVARDARAEEEQPPPVTKVELREQPDIAKVGKVAIYRGEADGKGVAFYLDGIGIGVPVGLMLVSGDSAAPMHLAVKNDLSKDWDRKVAPDESGIAQTRFRTEGPAMVLVTSSGELKPYQLLIWVGPEVKIHRFLKSPFGGGRSGSGGGAVIGLVVAGGVVLLIALVFLVRRSRKGKRA